VLHSLLIRGNEEPASTSVVRLQDAPKRLQDAPGSVLVGWLVQSVTPNFLGGLNAKNKRLFGNARARDQRLRVPRLRDYSAHNRVRHRLI